MSMARNNRCISCWGWASHWLLPLAVVCCLGMLSGYAVGRVDLVKQSLGEHDLYEDSVYWAEVEHED